MKRTRNSKPLRQTTAVKRSTTRSQQPAKGDRRPSSNAPAMSDAAVLADRALVGIGVVAYLALLIMVAVQGNFALLLRIVLVTVIGFVLVTVVRARINAPRPYEVNNIAPRLGKNTKGKSFPSRHCFSMFIIALCWLSVMPAVGWALLVLACILAVVRVVGGVHFPRDVVAGAIVAIAFWFVGFVLILPGV